MRTLWIGEIENYEQFRVISKREKCVYQHRRKPWNKAWDEWENKAIFPQRNWNALLNTKWQPPKFQLSKEDLERLKGE